MDVINVIRKAYQQDHLPGSGLTKPLRVCNLWFKEKTHSHSQDPWKWLAWKVTNFIFIVSIFPILGTLALIGTAINCSKTIRREHRSLRTKAPLPEEIESFCAVLREDIAENVWIDKTEPDALRNPHSHLIISKDATDSLYGYSYSKNQGMDFKFEVDPDLFAKAKASDQARTYMRELAEKIGTLCQKFSFVPEKYSLSRVSPSQYTVRLFIPDHVPFYLVSL